MKKIYINIFIMLAFSTNLLAQVPSTFFESKDAFRTIPAIKQKENATNKCRKIERRG
jgi:hypothetical protein